MMLLETEQTDFPSPPKFLINNLNYLYQSLKLYKMKNDPRSTVNLHQNYWPEKNSGLGCSKQGSDNPGLV